MLVLLCRNRVEDYDRWKSIFDSHASDQVDSGLELIQLWRDTKDSNNVFFIFKVTDLQKAETFISTPEASEIGKASGVLEGECHFLESV